MNPNFDINSGTIQLVPVKDIIVSSKNPRSITADNLKKLMDSIREDPDFLTKRPILLNHTNGKLMVYAGTQRLLACKKLGYTEVPCILDDDLDEETMDSRMIKDNVSAGEWDDVKLKDNFSKDLLERAGLDTVELYEDDFEEKISKYDNENCVYPITPTFGEKYDYVIITVSNELDRNFLLSWFEMENEKSYKNSAVGQAHVITFERFKKLVLSKDLKS